MFISGRFTVGASAGGLMAEKLALRSTETCALSVLQQDVLPK